MANRILVSLATILLLLVILVTSFQAVTYWIPGWWKYEYDKHNSVAYINGEMSLDDVVYISDQVMYYCDGQLNTLDDVKTTIDDQEVLFFTDREKIHLADCRVIITRLLKLRNLSLLLFLICAIALYVRKAKRKTVARGYLVTTAVVLCFSIALIIIAASNFDAAFTKFHEIFFNNDYWLLDPNKDNLINIMREGVFQDTAALIVGIWLAFVAILSFLSVKLLKSNKIES